MNTNKNVTHPAHYNSGKIEVIEAIEDWKLNFHRGNAVKYVARAGKKDAAKEIEDLKKAVWYVERDIERLAAKNENREITRPNDMNPTQAPKTSLRVIEKANKTIAQLRENNWQLVRERLSVSDELRSLKELTVEAGKLLWKLAPTLPVYEVPGSFVKTNAAFTFVATLRESGLKIGDE